MVSPAVVDSSLFESRKFGAALRGGVSFVAMCAFAVAAPAYAQEAGSPEQVNSGNPGVDDLQADAPGATDDTGEDAIVVTGYRQSLQNAQAIKRNSDSIVDSVTAEDIGALPDRSVLETLQRIPGVSISRFVGGNDPDHFSGEGSQATVRGLTYVRSEFNGREAFSALNGRSLGFQDVASEMLGGVDVFKSPTADRIEGGISGIVNLRTRKPFDSKGAYVAGSIEMNYGDFVGKSAPTASIVGSQRWDTGIGEVGILGSFVYSQLFTRNDRLQVSSFRNRPIYTDGTRTDVVPFGTATTSTRQGIFPRGAVMGTQETNRERYGYSAAVQWRSLDGSIEAAFQFMRSDARQAWTENTIEIATDNVQSNGDSRARAGTSITFDEDALFDQGLITGPTGWRADQQVNPPFTGAGFAGRRTPVFGLQSNNQGREHIDRSVTDDYGFNLTWDVSDRIGVSVDYSHIESYGEVMDNGLWGSSYQDVFMDLNGLDIPTVRFLAPQNCTGSALTAQGTCTGTPGATADYPRYLQGADGYLDPANSFWRAAMDHAEESEGNSDAFRIDTELSFPDTPFLSAVRVGYRYANRNQIARNSTYNWGALSEQWGNGGPVWFDEQIGGTPGDNLGTAPAGNYAPFLFDNFFRGQAGNPALGRLYYSGNPARDYAAYVNFAKSIRNEWFPARTELTGPFGGGANGWLPLAERPGVTEGYYLPGEINPIEETNHAAYIMARLNQDFDNGWNFSGNVGVRYSKTNRTSEGFIQYGFTDPLTADVQCRDTIQRIVNPQAGQSRPDQPNVPLGCAFLYTNPQARANARAFQNGVAIPNNFDLDYDYFLPSVNLKLEVGGGLQFRAAYFKGISPPNTTQIRNYFPLAISAQAPAGTVLPVTPNTATADPNDGIIGNENLVRIDSNGGIRVGSPDLLPVTSDNFDLTAEWYFSQVGSLTLSAFYKEIKGVVVFDTERNTFTNNGQTYSTVITREANSEETGKVRGLEVAYQQTYDFLPGPLAGFGLQANYTYVKSTGVPQATLPPGDPNVNSGVVSNVDISGFPLERLSKHNVNITPFYDYQGLSVRASYSWRSRYLLTSRDVITPYDPVFQEDYGQLDASIFYQVTPNFRLGLQGVNLTNSITKTSVAVQGPGGVDDIRIIPRGWFMQDRRVSAIARFNF